MVESDGSDDDDDQVKKLLIKHAQKEESNILPLKRTMSYSANEAEAPELEEKADQDLDGEASKRAKLEWSSLNFDCVYMIISFKSNKHEILIVFIKMMKCFNKSLLSTRFVC